ncbi:NUDIX hydrolase [Cryptosporangium aurantiacum]|uniref:8-oxo-dGTP diphosphatase n=1 Tax=Cryptosporangium aurantiacum TaxID=134849 RepID=A0A1M7HPW3_9ACTN|nr:NUDIX domain-containing protein [Cryptosporangium aurantiacum]SHM30592.1 8-oxo-dGTP diphosphatase [Cryptosporangium aurantiacum]
MISDRHPEVRAAGGVLWRRGADGVEIALIHRPRYDDWSLPKGKLDPDEHELAAACREVIEETGLQPVVGPRLPSTSYLVPPRGGQHRAAGSGLVPKVVDYWAMRATGGEFTRNAEVDGMTWLPPEEAVDRVTHAHDGDVVRAFAALPEITATILLIRHAKAGDKKTWPGPDDERPLEGSGQAQAVWLAELLPWFRPERVLSAVKVRCRQTAEPLAAALGVDVVDDARFDEETFSDDPEAVVARVRELAADGGVSAVCSQGGLIPGVIAELAEADEASVDANPVAHRNDGLRSRKGSVWVLHFAGERLVQADYLPSIRPESNP